MNMYPGPSSTIWDIDVTATVRADGHHVVYASFKNVQLLAWSESPTSKHEALSLALEELARAVRRSPEFFK